MRRLATRGRELKKITVDEHAIRHFCAVAKWSLIQLLSVAKSSKSELSRSHAGILNISPIVGGVSQRTVVLTKPAVVQLLMDVGCFKLKRRPKTILASETVGELQALMHDAPLCNLHL